MLLPLLHRLALLLSGLRLRLGGVCLRDWAHGGLHLHDNTLVKQPSCAVLLSLLLLLPLPQRLALLLMGLQLSLGGACLWDWAQDGLHPEGLRRRLKEMGTKR